MNPVSSSPSSSTLKISGVFEYSEQFNLHDLRTSIESRDDGCFTSRTNIQQQQKRPMMKELFHQMSSRTMDVLNSHLPAIMQQDSYRSADDSDTSINILSFTSLTGPGETEVSTPSTELASSLARRGKMMLRSGQYDDALAYFQQALPLQREIYGSRHKVVAATLNNLGVTYKYLSRRQPQPRDMYERLAIRSFEEALSILQYEFGPNDKTTVKTLNNLWQLMQDITERKTNNGHYISRDFRNLTSRSA